VGSEVIPSRPILITSSKARRSRPARVAECKWEPVAVAAAVHEVAAARQRERAGAAALVRLLRLEPLPFRVAVLLLLTELLLKAADAVELAEDVAVVVARLQVARLRPVDRLA